MFDFNDVPTKQDENEAFFVYTPTALFHYEIDSIPVSNGVYKVKGQIKNDKLDTLMFHSSTCNGERNLLVIDTAQVNVEYMLNCNASFPRVIALAPGQSHYFTFYIRMDKYQSEIRLGFRILETYSKEPAKSMADLETMKRNFGRNSVIWGSNKY